MLPLPGVQQDPGKRGPTRSKRMPLISCVRQAGGTLTTPSENLLFPCQNLVASGRSMHLRSRIVLAKTTALLLFGVATAAAKASDAEATGRAGGETQPPHPREKQQQHTNLGVTTTPSLQRGEYYNGGGGGGGIRATTTAITPTTTGGGRNLKGMVTTRCGRHANGRRTAGAMGCRRPPPTRAPGLPRTAPTRAPTMVPTPAPTQTPTMAANRAPTLAPTRAPTLAPTQDFCSTLKTNPKNGHLYGLMTYEMDGISWPEANATVNSFKSCCERRPHLASITGQEENDFW
jgi:hypothetical protein